MKASIFFQPQNLEDWFYWQKGGKKIALRGGGGDMNAHFPNPPLLGRRAGTIDTECQRGWYFCLRVQ